MEIINLHFDLIKKSLLLFNFEILNYVQEFSSILCLTITFFLLLKLKNIYKNSNGVS